LPALIKRLGRAAVTKAGLAEQNEFWIGQKVEILWHKDNQWYPACVKQVHAGGLIDAELSLPGWFGSSFKYMLPENIRVPPPDTAVAA